MKQPLLKDRCTDGFQETVRAARRIALRDGVPAMQPRHLAASLAARGSSAASRCLADLGVEITEILGCPAIAAHAPAGGSAEGVSVDSSETNTVLLRAVMEAAALRHGSISTQHLLLALVTEVPSYGRKIRGRGITVEELRHGPWKGWDS